MTFRICICIRKWVAPADTFKRALKSNLPVHYLIAENKNTTCEHIVEYEGSKLENETRTRVERQQVPNSKSTTSDLDRLTIAESLMHYFPANETVKYIQKNNTYTPPDPRKKHARYRGIYTRCIYGWPGSETKKQGKHTIFKKKKKKNTNDARSPGALSWAPLRQPHRLGLNSNSTTSAFYFDCKSNTNTYRDILPPILSRKIGWFVLAELAFIAIDNYIIG